MGLGQEVCHIVLSGTPDHLEVTLLHSVADPVVAGSERLGFALLAFIVRECSRNGVVIDDLGGWLWVTEVS